MSEAWGVCYAALARFVGLCIFHSQWLRVSYVIFFLSLHFYLRFRRGALSCKTPSSLRSPHISQIFAASLKRPCWSRAEMERFACAFLSVCISNSSSASGNDQNRNTDILRGQTCAGERPIKAEWIPIKLHRTHAVRTDKSNFGWGTEAIFKSKKNTNSLWEKNSFESHQSSPSGIKFLSPGQGAWMSFQPS